MAVDYARHGIELSRLSESELAARFNAQFSRAIRFEPKRSEAAERLISMHKRHGEVVTRVLQEKIAEQAEKLIKGTIDDSSLLALVLGKKHLEYSERAAGAMEAELSGTAKDQDGIITDSQTLERLLTSVFAKFETKMRRRTPIKKKLLKRDTVIFAAILLGLEGLKYCSFLQEYGVRPKSSDSDSSSESYPKSYKAGDPSRKRVQDEKTRAKARMGSHTNAELADAFGCHLPDREDELRRLLSTREAHAVRTGHSKSVQEV